MTDYQCIAFATDANGVTTLTLNRPDRLNSFNKQMIEEWNHALGRIGVEDTTRVVVLTGAGRAFCAGGDVDEMAELLSHGNVPRKDYLWRNIHRIPLSMEKLDKPVIAAINGTARGAGLDMTLMCDIRIAAQSATFAESYINMGLIAGDGGMYYLPRLVGVARAFEMLWTGKAIDSAEAERIGLVSRVVADDQVLATAQALAAEIAAQPQDAIRLTKRTLYQGLTSTLPAHLDMVSSHMAVLYDTPEFNARLQGFRERRKK
jgi:enoyl-CoA hydratase/carnithine racemase